MYCWCFAIKPAPDWFSALNLVTFIKLILNSIIKISTTLKSFWTISYLRWTLCLWDIYLLTTVMGFFALELSTSDTNLRSWDVSTEVSLVDGDMTVTECVSPYSQIYYSRILRSLLTYLGIHESISMHQILKAYK